MSIYNKNGGILTSAYSVSSEIDIGYNIGGSVVFQKGAPTIKVMSYNVGQWYYGGHVAVPADKDAAYYALQNAMIANADADILCMNEYLSEFSATGRTALSLLSQYFPYIHEQNGTGTVTSGTGRCICSKYPISNYSAHTYATSGSPRYYDSCTITIDGTPITVVVTHLNYNASSDTSRVSQLNELITFLQGQTHFIACGDLNTLYAKTTEEADYRNMIQLLLNAGFNLANCDDGRFLITYSDQPTGTYVGCLDNIITSSNITITGASVDTTKLNDGLSERVDHMPLIANLTIN